MKIEAYQLKLNEIETDAVNLLPLKKMPAGLNTALDAITGACEQGKLTRDGWVKQCFATKAVFNKFLETLADYDEFYRLHDRWWHALDHIADTGEEYEFIRTDDIANALREAAIETGQIKS